MTNEEIFMEMVDRSRSKPRWHILVRDFANIVKAFMGSNYLSVAYAFKQSGLVLGIIGLLLIAFITDHCCDLIVKCKYHAIQFVLDKQISRKSSLSAHKSEASLKSCEKSEDDAERSRQDAAEITKRMTRSITYGDIGKLACGNFGAFIVNACVIITQLGFCIGYCIFIGNTLFSLFPSTNVSVNTIVTKSPMASYASEMSAVNVNKDYTQNKESLFTNSFDYQPSVQINDSSHNVLESLMPSIANSTIPPTDSSTSFITINDAPDLRLLVISPVPLFFAFALLRNVRNLGFVSVGADLSLFLGCAVTLIYISIGFELSSSWEMFNWKTFPVFFGMITASYEGIGTVIPIESSMEGNRHNFSKFLHGAVLILTCILTVFGTMGYLEYGQTTEQMLNKHIPSSDGFGIVINIFLCIGVILTFPLQVYPVIELLELYLLGPGAVCGRGTVQKLWWKSRSEDKQELIPKNEFIIPPSVTLTAMDEVSTWKRNLLRLFVVLFAAGIAVLMRNLFAYVNAFIGAIGSSLLAYVLPCIFHLRLCWHKLGYGIKIKDICIIVFGVAASLVSLYTTILEVIDKV